jgi:hypothetical protein
MYRSIFIFVYVGFALAIAWSAISTMLDLFSKIS